MSKIYVLHENDDWTEPLLHALQRANLPYEDWHLNRGAIDLSVEPPRGVFYSRMSASSHTRGHRFAPEYTACVLSWLERHHRCVMNGCAALTLELSKVAQYCALERAGIPVPRTVAAVDAESLVKMARNFPAPFITKHNRAGRGLGVRLFEAADQLAHYVKSDQFEPSPDGITLLQEYIRSPDQAITRVEIIGWKLLYAVRVDTKGGFELCPCDTDACAVDTRPQFEIIADYHHPLVERYCQVAREHNIHVVAFEQIRDENGTTYTYDINTNTNYNGAAERAAGVSAMEYLATYLGRALRELR